MLAKQAIVAFTQGGDVIPDNARHINRIVQAVIRVTVLVETILVGSIHFDYAWHRFNPILVRGSVGVCSTATDTPYFNTIG